MQSWAWGTLVGKALGILWVSFLFLVWLVFLQGGQREQLQARVAQTSIIQSLENTSGFLPVSCFSLAAHGRCLEKGEVPAVNPGFYLVGFGTLQSVFESVFVRRGRFDLCEIQVCFVGRVWICSVFALCASPWVWFVTPVSHSRVSLCLLIPQSCGGLTGDRMWPRYLWDSHADLLLLLRAPAAYWIIPEFNCITDP